MKKSAEYPILFSIGLAISGCNVLAADNMPKISEEDREKFPITIEVAKCSLAHDQDDIPSHVEILDPEGLVVTLKEEKKNIVNMTIKTDKGLPDMSSFPSARLEHMLLHKILTAYKEAWPKQQKQQEEEKFYWMPEKKYRTLDDGAQCHIFKHDRFSGSELECNVTVPIRIYDALKVEVMSSRK